MNTFSRLAASAIASLAVTASTLAVATTADAATASGHTAVAAHSAVTGDLAARKGKSKIKLKLSQEGFNAGMPPITVSAKVKGVKKGKMTFSVGKSKKKVKIKKGKAHYTVPAALGPGVYKVRAKFGHRKGKKAFSVWSSKLTLNQTSVTIQKDNYNNPNVTGSVIWHGGPATTGYVDFYQDGKFQGGSSSPYLAGFGAIESGGVFTMDGYEFESYFEDKGLPSGSYTFQGYYTSDAGFDDYIYSTPLTVVWNATPPKA